MLLHDAVLEILGDREMTFSEIAAALNRSDLYRKRNGSHMKQDRMGARVRSPRYAELFVLDRSDSPQPVRARLPSLPPRDIGPRQVRRGSWTRSGACSLEAR